MQTTIDLIIATLRLGMTTGYQDSDDFYVKTWYTGDPLALPALESPAGAVIPKPPTSRLIEFVGLDTITETFAIRLYQLAVRKVTEDPETASGVTRLISMLEKAQLLLRVDPTFSSSFVMTEIRSVDPMLGGVPGADIYRMGEIMFEVKRRALWGS